MVFSFKGSEDSDHDWDSDEYGTEESEEEEEEEWGKDTNDDKGTLEPEK